MEAEVRPKEAWTLTHFVLQVQSLLIVFIVGVESLPAFALALFVAQLVPIKRVVESWIFGLKFAEVFLLLPVILQPVSELFLVKAAVGPLLDEFCCHSLVFDGPCQKLIFFFHLTLCVFSIVLFFYL